jgi:hypothetical protein
MGGLAGFNGMPSGGLAGLIGGARWRACGACHRGGVDR